MSKSVDTLVAEIRSRIHSLLHDEVIQHTIVVMRTLGDSLSELAGIVRNEPEAITEDLKAELTEILLPLTSESIREALHKNELHITNGIIRSKNRILTSFGVPIPERHGEIDARKYPNYNW